ncbi:MAG: PEP-CTERM sorting domain-containing protein [Pseudomonadota bacterium]|nr:PEP-CTERM sorting domain-containing protein [Pseudomonadota bacterium]
MSMFRKLTALGALTLSMAIAAPASANLIVNGSFEAPDIPNGSWQYYSPDQVPGWEGSNIEIWQNYNGVSAADGDQFAELNAHPSTGTAFGIYQDIDTVVGDWYTVSFAYRARQSNNEAFDFSFGDLTTLVNDHTTSEWSLFSANFQAIDLTTRILFTSVNPETGTIGNFLDDVKVAAVPEPGTLALLSMGLLGLGLSRRRRA